MPADWLKKPPTDFDIVTAYYPESNPKGAIELRPCLVVGVYKDAEASADSGDDCFLVEVYFGTKNIKHVKRARIDLIVQNAADMDAMNLAYATRFDLAESVMLPWDEESFGPWRGFPSPVLSFLDDDYQNMLQRRLARNAKRKGKAA